MDNELLIKIADDISEKLISITSKNDVNKTFLELYHELLSSEYKEYESTILSYIPERLAVKGYEVINQKYFGLKKY